MLELLIPRICIPAFSMNSTQVPSAQSHKRLEKRLCHSPSSRKGKEQEIYTQRFLLSGTSCSAAAEDTECLLKDHHFLDSIYKYPQGQKSLQILPKTEATQTHYCASVGMSPYSYMGQTAQGHIWEAPNNCSLLNAQQFCYWKTAQPT